ncbi:MAG: DUF4013 domain-containing protein [Candidatus Methanomethylicaceae archaeon]
MIVSIIPVINLIAIGYYGRVIKDKSESKTPPILHGFWDLFVDGLKAITAGLIWAIPVIILFLVTFIPVFRALRWEHMMTYATQPMILLRVASFILVLLTFVVAFLISIVAGIGIVHMFKTDSFGKAFAVGEIITIINKIGLMRYLFWLIVAVVLGMVVSVFGMIPMIGWIISDLLGILLLIFLARSIGLMYDYAVAPVVPQPQPPQTSAPQPPPPPPSPP